MAEIQELLSNQTTGNEPHSDFFAAVIGSPIRHSLSPVIHHAAYRDLGLTRWHYQRHELNAGQVAAWINALPQNYRGLSITAPLKRAVLPIAEKLSPAAQLTGVVNTLVRHDNHWCGENTDIAGIHYALTVNSHDPPAPASQSRGLSHGRAAIWGAGATAVSALVALADLGVTEVDVACRHPLALDPLRDVASEMRVQVTHTSFDERLRALRDSDILISTVPAATLNADAPPEQWPDDLHHLRVLDVVYHPWPTGLAVLARQSGAHLASGLDMLVAQAVEQVHLMTGRRPDLAPMRTAALHALQSGQ